MSVYETLPQADPGVHIHKGVFARDVPDFVTKAIVTLPHFDHALKIEGCAWQPRGSLLPKRGDDCLVLLDNSQQPWVAAWWPKNPVAIFPIEATDINLHVGAAPPGSPVDKMFWLLPADAGNGINWLMRYNAGSSSGSKWEFIGGPALYSFVAAEDSVADNNYVALANAGPSVALPRPGDYEVEIGCHTYFSVGTGSAGRMSYDIGGTGAVDADSIFSQPTVTGFIVFVSSVRRKTGLLAVTLTAKYTTHDAAKTAQFSNRYMKVTPVRLS